MRARDPSNTFDGPGLALEVLETSCRGAADSGFCGSAAAERLHAGRAVSHIPEQPQVDSSVAGRKRGEEVAAEVCGPLLVYGYLQLWRPYRLELLASFSSLRRELAVAAGVVAIICDSERSSAASQKLPNFIYLFFLRRVALQRRKDKLLPNVHSLHC